MCKENNMNNQIDNENTRERDIKRYEQIDSLTEGNIDREINRY